MDADPGDVLFFHCFSLRGSKANKSENSRKTVLIQFYSGKDKIEYYTHKNVHLALRGWNHYATRSKVDGIGV